MGFEAQWGCLALIFALLFSVGGAQAAESTVHMKDGSKISGEIVAEDDNEIQVKVKFGTITLERKEIDKIESSGGSTAAPAKEGRDETFRNGFLEYAVSRPGRTWIFVKSPPEPLADLVIYNARYEAEVTVLVLPDETPHLELREENLEFFLRAIEHKLREKYRKIRKVSSEAGKFKGLAAYEATYDAVSKLNKRAYVFRYRVFKAKDRLYTIYNAVPTALFDRVEPELQSIADSFEFIEAKEFEGDLYSNFKFLYSVERPAEWSFSAAADGSSFVAPDGRADFVVTARAFYGKESLAKIALDREGELADSFDGFRKRSSKPVNLLSTVVQELKYTDRTADGTRETREIILLSNTRLYLVQARRLSSAAADHAAALRKAVGSFSVRRDLTSKATIEEGMRAIELFDKGDKEIIEKRHEAAIDFYKAAIGIFPNFAVALNNMGVCYERRREHEKFFAHIQRAFNLFPEHVTVRRNLGAAYAYMGIEKTKSGKYSAAIRDFNKALKYNPEARGFEKNLAIAHFNEGINRLNEGSCAAATGSISRALKLDPNNQQYKRALSIAYYNLAVGYANRRQYPKAIIELNKSVRADPSNGQAKNLLAQLRQRMRR